jgi:5-methylcytosine-specific restriction endonuclease McrA
MSKKKIQTTRTIALTHQQSKQILEMLESLRSINAQTDDKCPIDYDMVCKLDGMEHQLANIVDATVECEHGHYSRWSGAYEYK